MISVTFMTGEYKGFTFVPKSADEVNFEVVPRVGETVHMDGHEFRVKHVEYSITTDTNGHKFCRGAIVKVVES